MENLNEWLQYIKIVHLLLQRLSARELLRHRFVKAAKKNAILTELIEKHARWKAEGGDENDSSDDDER